MSSFELVRWKCGYPARTAIETKHGPAIFIIFHNNTYRASFEFGGGFKFEVRLSINISGLRHEGRMGTQYSHIDMAERRLIQEMVVAGIPVAAIARRLCRHRSTIHREISRNFYHTSFRDRWGKDYRGYYCVTAHDMAQERRRRLAKLRAGLKCGLHPPTATADSPWPGSTHPHEYMQMISPCIQMKTRHRRDNFSMV